MKHVLSSLSLILAVSAVSAHAAEAPTDLIVREDAQGNRVVYRATLTSQVTSELDAQAAVKTFVIEENKIADIKTAVRGELDQTTSKDTWYWWAGYSAGYNYGSYYNNYTYNYGYNYSYYANYGYNYTSSYYSYNAYAYYPYSGYYNGGYLWSYYRHF